MSRAARVALLSAALAAAGPGARAQDRPLLVPNRDVDVLYRMTAPPASAPGSSTAPGAAPGAVPGATDRGSPAQDAAGQSAAAQGTDRAAAQGADRGALTQRLRWLAARRLMRVDPPGGAAFMIIDYAARRMQMVEPGARTVIDMPAPPGLGDAAPGTPFQRLGEDSVAQTPCTLWRTADLSGRPAVVCLTPDGVLLRAGKPGENLIEAGSVRYAAQDPSVFAVPDGFRHLAAPRPVPPGALQ